MTWLQADDDRLSELFDMAQRDSDNDLFSLPENVRNEVIELRQLLDIIDIAWQVQEASIDRVHALFLRKLAATNPQHPWVQGSMVRTLGELIRAGDEIPNSLAGDFYKQISEDLTPVESLIDRASRNRVIGQIVQRAGLSKSSISDLVLWLSKLVSNLMPSTNNPHQGLIFTRRQGNRHKGARHND